MGFAITQGRSCSGERAALIRHGRILPALSYVQAIRFVCLHPRGADETLGLTLTLPDAASDGRPFSAINTVITVCEDGSLCCGDAKAAASCCENKKGYLLQEDGQVVLAHPPAAPVPAPETTKVVVVQNSPTPAKSTPAPSPQEQKQDEPTPAPAPAPASSDNKSPSSPTTSTKAEATTRPASTDADEDDDGNVDANNNSKSTSKEASESTSPSTSVPVPGATETLSTNPGTETIIDNGKVGGDNVTHVQTHVTNNTTNNTGAVVGGVVGGVAGVGLIGGFFYWFFIFRVSRKSGGASRLVDEDGSSTYRDKTDMTSASAAAGMGPGGVGAAAAYRDDDDGIKRELPGGQPTQHELAGSAGGPPGSSHSYGGGAGYFATDRKELSATSSVAEFPGTSTPRGEPYYGEGARELSGEHRTVAEMQANALPGHAQDYYEMPTSPAGAGLPPGVAGLR